MIVEIRDVFEDNKILINILDVESVFLNNHYKSYNDKTWYEINITFKSGNNCNVSFHDYKEIAESQYLKIKSGLELTYEKDNIKDIIKKALKEEQ